VRSCAKGDRSANRCAVGSHDEPQAAELEHVVAEHAAGRVVDIDDPYAGAGATDGA
jgi:hypothetical protein